MRLLVLLVFLCSLGRAARISNETYQDSPIGLIYEIQLRDFLHETSIGDEANDAFIVALWDETRSNVFLWTNGPFFPPSLYRVNYVDLLTAVSDNDIAVETAEFIGATTSVSVETGVYSASDDSLIIAGGKVLYKITGASTTLGDVAASFVFPYNILAFSSYRIDTTAWFVQFKNIETGTSLPNAIAVPFSDYGLGYPAGQRPVLLEDEEMVETYHHEESNTLFLGTRKGVVQIRDSSSPELPLIANFSIYSPSGNDATVGGFAYDPNYNRLYICLDVDDGVKFMRLDVSDGFDSWSGAEIDSNATDASGVLWESLLRVGSCEDIAIDSFTGTGFVAMVDSTGIGFLAKTMEAAISYVPIERENSRIVSLSLQTINDRKLLFGVTTYTVAVWNFTTACSADCNEDEGRGTCVDGFCECAPEWWGLSCVTPSCDPPCGDYDDPFRGECIQGSCVCQPRWSGPGCNTERCPNDCNGNGDCNVGDNFTCECNDVRGGEDCSTVKFQWCDQINHADLNGSLYDACLELTPILGCAYCGGSYDVCLDGNRQGPTGVGDMIDSCLWFFYDGYWNPAFLVFIIVMMVSWGIMFIINTYTALKEDLKFAKNSEDHRATSGDRAEYLGSKGYQKKLWWRDDRSHKAWKMFDQMQFLSAYGVINAIFTTKLYNFLAFWNWSLFIIPFGGEFEYVGENPMRAFNYTPINFPFPPIPPGVWDGEFINRTKREIDIVEVTEPLAFAQEVQVQKPSLEYEAYSRTPMWSVKKRDWEQFVNSAETKPELIYPTAVIWFLIVLFGFLILYSVYYCIMIFCVHKGKKSYKQILTYRFRHVIFRVLHAWYFPSIFLSVFAVQVKQEPIIILAIVFGIIINGIALPLVLWRLTRDFLTTDWLSPGMRIPYGSFFSPFKKKKMRFPFAIYLRKFAAGCALAALARGYDPDNEALFWAQMIITLAVFVIYLIFLICQQPYIDMIHLIIDAALCLLNAITILLSLLAIQADPGTQDALQWIVLVIQIPCMFLVIVAYCWSSMFYHGYTSPKQVFGCADRPDPSPEDLLPMTTVKKADNDDDETKGPDNYDGNANLEGLSLPSSDDGVN